MVVDNPYLSQLHMVLPRLLALYDTDPLSPSFGLGDRFYWAWKLIDFGNGTFQGAANGLTRMLEANILPVGIAQQAIERRISACFRGADYLRRRNGSMEEAFPYESSFCVTGLVVYDLLTSLELQRHSLSESVLQDRLSIVAPMIHFLQRSDEHHAFISNHLATVAVALYKWHALTGEQSESSGRRILDRILLHQSEEGWYEEYGGADPGYQSLCTYYLADLHRLRPDLDLAESLCKSLQFLYHFAQPDGSFGGIYGSRHTRFYYPAGVELIVHDCEYAAVLANFMRRSIANKTTVTLDVMDAANLVPMFNCYAWAATLLNSRNDTDINEDLLPSERDNYSADFNDAGLHIRGNVTGYTVVSSAKGGVFLFSDKNSCLNTVDSGVVAQNPKGQFFSTQVLQTNQLVELSQNRIVILSALRPMHHQSPTPWQFIILRLMNVSLMRSTRIGDFVKQLLVRMLITGGRPLKSKVKRTIDFQNGEPQVSDELLLDEKDHLEPVDTVGEFSAIHMASKGYWQIQDDKS